MASFPTSVVVFPTRTDGTTIFAAHLNLVQDEVAAIEAALIKTAGQSSAEVRIRRNGNCLEFGHTNAAGYGSQLGSESGSGKPFLGFNCEHGTNANTYLTRGVSGVVLRSDLAGALVVGRVATASADNQSPTDVVSVGGAGNVINSATQPRAVAFHSTTQSIADSTWTTIDLDSEDLDVGSCHDTAVNNPRLTVPAGAGGLYLVIGAVGFAANTTGIRGVRLMKNAGVNVGSGALAPGASGAGAGTVVVATALAALNAGDYVYMDALQTSGAALNTGFAGNRTLQNSLQFVKLW